MDANLFDKWVADLRSSPPQAKGLLHNPTKGSCCLGRLCIVAEIPTVGVEGNGDWEFKDPAASDGRTVAFLPSDVRFNRLGPFTSDLMSMNDSGAFFNEIADFLEKNRSKIVGPVGYYPA